MPYYTMESVWHAGLSMGELTARDEDIFRMSDLIPPYRRNRYLSIQQLPYQVLYFEFRL